MKNWKLIALASLAVLASCKDDEEEEVVLPDFYVTNEGAFGSSNGSVSSVDESLNVSNTIYNAQNGVDLGDVVQSMAISHSQGYIAVNNSQKVSIVDLVDFSSITDITLSYPRFFATYNDDVFVSNGSGAGMVYTIDAHSNTIVDSVAVGNGPEQMVVSNGNLFVANSGGWGVDSTVSVVNIASNVVTNTINVGHKPFSIDVDANGDIWTLCAGSTQYDSLWNVVGGVGPELVKINGSTFEVVQSLSLGDHTVSASRMTIDSEGQNIYYVENGVKKMSISATSLPNSNFIDVANAKAVAVHPNGKIMVTIVPDYTSNGSVKVYDANGTLEKTLEVGIAPNHISFN